MHQQPCSRHLFLSAIIFFTACVTGCDPASESRDTSLKTPGADPSPLEPTAILDDLAEDSSTTSGKATALADESAEDPEEKPSPESPDSPGEALSPESEQPTEDPSTDKANLAPQQSKQPLISSDAFRMAAYEGNLNRVRTAVESGMDVNGFDPTQKLTALHMAAYNGHTAVVQYLIGQGATVDSRDGEKKTPLIHACTGPFAATVKALIQAGADVNAQDGTESFTPLMMAAGLGESEIVDILLTNKASVDQKDEDDDTAIDHARNAGHESIVKILETALGQNP